MRIIAGEADRVIAEVNFGGALVVQNIKTVDKYISVVEMRASRGKVARADPVANLYQMGKVHHVGTTGLGFEVLEDQMCAMTMHGYEGDRSPDRADALCWAILHFFPHLLDDKKKEQRKVQRVAERGGMRVKQNFANTNQAQNKTHPLIANMRGKPQPYSAQRGLHG